MAELGDNRLFEVPECKNQRSANCVRAIQTEPRGFPLLAGAFVMGATSAEMDRQASEAKNVAQRAKRSQFNPLVERANRSKLAGTPTPEAGDDWSKIWARPQLGRANTTNGPQRLDKADASSFAKASHDYDQAHMHQHGTQPATGQPSGQTGKPRGFQIRHVLESALGAQGKKLTNFNGPAE